MITVESLFVSPNTTDSGETFTPLLERPGLKLERIDSHAQSSAPGFWYDQPEEEWVLLARGQAVLEIEGQPPLSLKAGEHLLLPAHTRHRVAQTSADAVWLALHLGTTAG